MKGRRPRKPPSSAVALAYWKASLAGINRSTTTGQEMERDELDARVTTDINRAEINAPRAEMAAKRGIDG